MRENWFFVVAVVRLGNLFFFLLEDILFFSLFLESYWNLLMFIAYFKFFMCFPKEHLDSQFLEFLY